MNVPATPQSDLRAALLFNISNRKRSCGDNTKVIWCLIHFRCLCSHPATGSMLRFGTSEEFEKSLEISQLKKAVWQNDDRLLNAMLCQEIYKKVINCKGGWGNSDTPLHAAVSKGHLSCLQVLLSHGALVDSLDYKSQTPLFTAVQAKYLECVLALLGAGANPDGNRANNCSPVLTAAREGDAQILLELLKHGAEVNSRSQVLLWNSSARSGPLYLAAVYGHMECFKLLLLYGADPDYNCKYAKLLSAGKHPETVLETCLRKGCGVEFIQLLIDFGANVYLPTLIIEKSTKQNEAVELLLEERGEQNVNRLHSWSVQWMVLCWLVE